MSGFVLLVVRNSHWKFFVKKMFLKISTEKFGGCNFIKKDTPTQKFSCALCEIFKRTPTFSSFPHSLHLHKSVQWRPLSRHSHVDVKHLGVFRHEHVIYSRKSSGAKKDVAIQFYLLFWKTFFLALLLRSCSNLTLVLVLILLLINSFNIFTSAVIHLFFL